MKKSKNATLKFRLCLFKSQKHKLIDVKICYMKYIIVLILFGISVQLKAQDYEKALGFRAGYTSGISYERFFGEITSIEAMLSTQRGGAQIAILRKYTHPIFLKVTDNCFFQYGVGPHIGFITWSNKKIILNGNSYRLRELSAVIGLNLFLGVEYHFQTQPVVVGLGYKPFMEINIPKYFKQNNYDFGLTIKYIIE